MSITKEDVLAAEELFTNVQADVFFRKLAALGITAENDEQAAALWELGDSILQQRPRLSDSGRTIKQASLEAFGNLCSNVANDGCSLDVHQIVEELLKNQQIVKAAHILMAVNNVT